MKNATVEIARGTKGKKVLQGRECERLKRTRIITGETIPPAKKQIYLRSFGHSFAEYFDFEVTEGSVEGYGLFASG